VSHGSPFSEDYNELHGMMACNDLTTVPVQAVHYFHGYSTTTQLDAAAPTSDARMNSGGPKVPVARAAARACWPKTTLSPLVNYDDLTILITCMCVMPRLEKLSGSATADEDGHGRRDAYNKQSGPFQRGERTPASMMGVWVTTYDEWIIN
jgi:hypothetical protein